MSRIRSLHARQILDSRGRPTVEVDATLEDGSLGRAAVPSGASTGGSEAHELRDHDPRVFGGFGVTRAVAHANGEIAAAVRGFDAADQRGLDDLLLSLDGTERLDRLGANAVLGSSLAVCRAEAASAGLPLYLRIAELASVAEPTLPMPMVNILSGGLHARGGMDVQDFLAIPARAQSIAEAIHTVALVRSAAAAVMAERGLTTLLADEGGLAPGLRTGAQALQLMSDACHRAGLEPGRDIVIAIDVAAHTLYDAEMGLYSLACEGRRVTAAEMIEMIASWVRDYPVVSVEDGLDEEDWVAWRTLTERLGDRVHLIGDDFFATNMGRLTRGVVEGCANGVLVKVNQNGTLSGTLEVIAAARRAGYAPVVSARSGETEDPFIADLAVGTAAGQIKIGSVRCSDRLAKYNQLLRIAEDSAVEFAGSAALPLAASSGPR
jgi:enolase